MIDMNRELEIAWAAGFVEGEGSFDLASPSWTSQSIRACQVQRDPLERLQSLFGGTISKRSQTYTGRGIYYWGIYGKNAVAVCHALISNLSPPKRAQARLLIAHRANCFRGSGKETTERIRNLRMWYRDQMKSLKAVA